MATYSLCCKNQSIGIKEAKKPTFHFNYLKLLKNKTKYWSKCNFVSDIQKSTTRFQSFQNFTTKQDYGYCNKYQYLGRRNHSQSLLRRHSQTFFSLRNYIFNIMLTIVKSVINSVKGQKTGCFHIFMFFMSNLFLRIIIFFRRFHYFSHHGRPSYLIFHLLLSFDF